MAVEVTETKDGTVIVECECGIITKLKYNSETEQIDVKQKIGTKKPEENKDNGKKTENKRTGIFSNRE